MKNLKRRGGITIMLVMIGIIKISAQNSIMELSLLKAIELAIENNVNVKNAGLEAQKACFYLKETQSKLYPQLEGYSSFSYYYAIPKMIIPGEIFGQSGSVPVELGTKYEWSSGFKATQILFNQSYFISLKLAREMENLNILSLRQQKEEIVFRVSQIYYLCLATSGQIKELRKTMDNTDRLLEIAKLQYENEIIRKTDYSRVLVGKNNLQTQIDNLEQLYEQQLALLKYLIGLELETDINLSDSLSLLQTGISTEPPDFSNRAEIKLIDQQIEITALSRKVNRQSYLPTLTAFGQYYYQGQRNEFDFFKGGEDKFYKVGFVGLSLNVPIFDGFEKHYKTHQYDIELIQLQNTRNNAAMYFKKEYSDALRQYENQLNALFRQQDNVKVAEETYSMSLQGYRQQVTTLSDLLLSESDLTEARLSHLNSLLQLKNAELEIIKAKGELLKY